MKVLLIHNRYQQPGGEDSVLENEVRLLKEFGNRVEVIEFHNDEMVHVSAISRLRKLLWNQNSYHKVRDLLDVLRPDVVHVHNFFAVASPSVYEAAWQAKIPVVQTLHNYRLLCPSGVLSRNGQPCMECLGSALRWPSIKHSCYRSSRVETVGVVLLTVGHQLRGTWKNRVTRYIALTQSMRDIYISNGFSKDHVSVKPHFIFPDLSPATESKRNQVLYLGRISIEKGVRFLIDAWRRYVSPDVNLTIAGDGPLRSEIDEASRHLPNVKVIGKIDKQRVFEELSRSRFIVVPSLCQETFGMVVLEAYAAGVPVLATRLGSFPELIEHGKTGLLFDPTSPEMLAAAVHELWGNPARCLEMGQAGYDLAHGRYSPKSNYEALIKIYEEARSDYHRTAAGGRYN